jgi:arsenical pump membrane protein
LPRLPSRIGGGGLLLLAGGVAAVSAAASDPASASRAASQDWPPFVLVTGLLLVGLVAAEDHLFAAAGELLAGAARSGWVLFAGVAALILVVTAVLNLDTSVAFLAPVLVHTARRRRDDEMVMLSACLLLSNAGSLLLPGSNLTNLIVLGHLHLSGGAFASRMGIPWLAAGLVTAGTVAWYGRRVLARRVSVEGDTTRPVVGLGLAAVFAATVLVVTVSSPAVPVLVVGVVAAGWRTVRGPQTLRGALDVVGLPVLLGLLGVAIGLGALGRDWSGPAHLLRHLGPWATAGVAAGSTVLLNNLPAASLLAARVPPHPYSLLIGLNLGPNLFVTGSLSWILWLRASAAAGGHPSVKKTVLIGVVAVPLSVAAALATLLAVTGSA